MLTRRLNASWIRRSTGCQSTDGVSREAGRCTLYLGTDWAECFFFLGFACEKNREESPRVMICLEFRSDLYTRRKLPGLDDRRAAMRYTFHQLSCTPLFLERKKIVHSTEMKLSHSGTLHLQCKRIHRVAQAP